MAGPMSPRGRGLPRILLVDDDPDIAEVVREFLQTNNFLVDTAADGRAALERLALRSPALIVLDLHLPGMDGLQFVEAYRQSQLQQVPIFLLSSATGLPQRAREIGAVGFSSKPCDFTYLVSELHRLTDLA